MPPRNRTRIPTTTQCYEIFKETGTLKHIKEHSETVTRVAKEIAQRLNEVGKNIDVELLVAAALLHDVTKTRSLRGQGLRRQGMIEIAGFAVSSQ